MDYKSVIAEGKACLGIEFGSTRIKAVLIGPDHAPIASGDHAWENRLENGVWTYHLDDIWGGLQDAYAKLAADVETKYGEKLTSLAAMGFSGMMHGYIAMDREDRVLVPFRTWRNTITAEAAEKLTEAFSFNVPQRWSIAHLYQAMLNGEEHVAQIAQLNTLACYIHYTLTGAHVVGVGEASGMFPIDSVTGDYDAAMMAKFDQLSKDYPWKLRDILPRVLSAGEDAGRLTEQGARKLDPTGTLKAGIPVCPPEGDAGTGMVATNAVAVRTGNVSAGTSIFAMIVLEKALSKVYPEIDMVTTPTGKPVAMVHCNNCTNEINAWAAVFKGLLEALGQKPDMNEVYTAMFQSAAKAEPDAGGVVSYNYLSGEPVTGFASGNPLMFRSPEARLSFANLMRAQLFSAVATLNLGLDILAKEDVRLDRLLGHGGFFKTPEVGQRIMAAATNAPVSVMETAGEGGPWGMALLAGFLAEKAEGQTLEDYLEHQVFAGQKIVTLEADEAEKAGFAAFMNRYSKGLAVERAAVEL